RIMTSTKSLNLLLHIFRMPLPPSSFASKSNILQHTHNSFFQVAHNRNEAAVVVVVTRVSTVRGVDQDAISVIFAKTIQRIVEDERIAAIPAGLRLPHLFQSLQLDNARIERRVTQLFAKPLSRA